MELLDMQPTSYVITDAGHPFVGPGRLPIESTNPYLEPAVSFEVPEATEQEMSLTAVRATDYEGASETGLDVAIQKLSGAIIAHALPGTYEGGSQNQQPLPKLSTQHADALRRALMATIEYGAPDDAQVAASALTSGFVDRHTERTPANHGRSSRGKHSR
jgi:hypothetical protein